MNVGTCAIVREIDLNGVLNKFHSRTKYPTGMKSCAAQDSIPTTNVIYPAAISSYVVIRRIYGYYPCMGDTFNLREGNFLEKFARVRKCSARVYRAVTMIFNDGFVWKSENIFNLSNFFQYVEDLVHMSSMRVMFKITFGKTIFKRLIYQKVCSIVYRAERVTV